MKYFKPYPPETANLSANYIERIGDDLFMYFTPRGDPNPRFNQLVDYYKDFVPYNPFLAGGIGGATTPPVQTLPPVSNPAVEIAPPEPVNTDRYQLPSEMKEVREGNDLVFYYPNGMVDRFKNYFAPTAGTVAPAPNALPTDAGWVKAPQSETRVGNDSVITFMDGTQKVLSGYYLPKISNPAVLNDNVYAFGTTLDPEWYVKNGYTPALKWLVRDQKDGTDRLQVYSDGSSTRHYNWFALNPQYDEPTSVPVSSFTPDDSRLDDYTPPDIYITDPRLNQPAATPAAPVTPAYLPTPPTPLTPPVSPTLPPTMPGTTPPPVTSTGIGNVTNPTGSPAPLVNPPVTLDISTVVIALGAFLLITR